MVVALPCQKQDASTSWRCLTEPQERSCTNRVLRHVLTLLIEWSGGCTRATAVHPPFAFLPPILRLFWLHPSHSLNPSFTSTIPLLRLFRIIFSPQLTLFFDSTSCPNLRHRSAEPSPSFCRTFAGLMSSPRCFSKSKGSFQRNQRRSSDKSKEKFSKIEEVVWLH